MRYFYITFFLVLFHLSSEARTCVSITSGNWESTGTWLCDGVPSIPAAGDNVYIQSGHTVTMTTNHQISGSGAVFIYVYGVLTFDQSGKITLPAGSGVAVMSGGSVVATGNGGSNKITIGNTAVWTSNDGDLEGGDTVGTPPPNSPLPVELLSFKGRANDNQIIIEWITASETNSSYFSVEKSSDGYTFREIGRINAAGTSDIQLDYDYTDEHPESINYYRLKEVDLDGTTQLSDIIAVRFENPDKAPVIFPNPSSNGGQITFSWKGFPESTAILTVTAMDGREVYRTTFTSPESFITLPVSELNISHGTYFVRFSSGSEVQLIPLVITR